MCNRNLHDCIHILSLPNCALDILQLGNASVTEVNRDWKIPANLHFMDLKKPLNWLKIK